MHTVSHCLRASTVSISVNGRREVEVSPEAVGASRWWEFVGLRVGVATNFGGSVYIVERHEVKGLQKIPTLGLPWPRRQPKDCRSVVGFVVCCPGVVSLSLTSGGTCRGVCRAPRLSHDNPAAPQRSHDNPTTPRQSHYASCLYRAIPTTPTKSGTLQLFTHEQSMLRTRQFSIKVAQSFR
jgi:hypothetical protein